MSAARRVGLFGGTFDPPHLGHLIAAEEVRDALQLDEVLWIPAGRPPHRPEGPVAPADVRVRLADAAIHGHDGFRVWDGETRRQGPSWTVDTLRALAEGASEPTEWTLIIGADQYRAFGEWREPEVVARLARLAVVSREGAGITPGEPRFPFHAVAIPRIDISSSEIRRRRKEGRSIRYLVPEPVRRIVEAEDLYV